MKKPILFLVMCIVVSSLFAQQPVELSMQLPGVSPFSHPQSTEIIQIAPRIAAVSTNAIDSLVFHVFVPEGTHECWVAGTFNRWDNSAHRMTMINDRNFSLTIPIEAEKGIDVNTLRYKYLSGPGDWVYVEKNWDNSEMDERVYHPNDTVAMWNQVYEPNGVSNGKYVTFETIAPFNVPYLFVFGSHNRWDTNDPEAQMYHETYHQFGKVFRKTVWVEHPSVMEYKFSTGPGWEYSQIQDLNYMLDATNIDTIRHRVFNYYTYFNSHLQPSNWNFSVEPFNASPHFYDVQEIGGLLVYGSPDIPMFVSSNLKNFERIQFQKVLKTNGPGRLEPQGEPVKPFANAIAFNVGEDTQVIFHALSDSHEDAKLFISNGVDTLAWASVSRFLEQFPDVAPRWVYRYQGTPTTLYMYTENVGVNFYFVGTTDYRGVPHQGPVTTYTVSVPEETAQVFIAGDFNGWQPFHNWMDRIDSVTFSTTIPGAIQEMEYKYLAGPNWNYVELNADGTERPNRTWTPLDVVERWSDMYIPEETSIYYNDVYTVPGEEIAITIKSTSNLPKEAISYQFRLDYDPNILEYLSYEVDGTVAETGTVLVNTTYNYGTLIVSFMSETPFSYTSDLITFNFNVVTPHSNHTHLWLYDVYFNDQQIFVMHPGNIVIEGYRPGDVDGNMVIQAYDAALTLQYSVGKDPLPHIDPLPWSLWRVRAADVDGVNGVTANDAALILQYSALMIDQFPVENNQSPLKIMGDAQPNITIERETDKLLVRSYGNLVGLNLYLKGESSDALGLPSISTAIDLSAVNIGEGVYAVGLAALNAPVDGTVIMTIPLNKTDNVDYDFTAYINTYQADISSRIATSVDNAMLNKVSFYPNPAKDMLNIRQLTDGSVVTITDISGRTVYSRVSNSTSMQINVADLANGVYTLSVTAAEGQRIVSKFIKQ